MSEAPGVLRAHSLAEIQLYFMLTPCPSCRRATLRPVGEPAAVESDPPMARLRASCHRCQRAFPSEFEIPRLEDGAATDPTMLINAGDEPSKLIDLSGWITLYRMIVERSWGEPDRMTARRLAWEAGLCLDEALKFYPAGENFPPDDAFFTAESLARYRQYRGQFDRRVVLDYRRRAPTLSARELAASEPGGGAAHSRFWQHHTRPPTGW